MAQAIKHRHQDLVVVPSHCMIMSNDQGWISFQLNAHKGTLGSQGMKERFLPVLKADCLLEGRIGLKQRSNDDG